MPASSNAYIFHTSDNLITAVYLTSEITSTEANAFPAGIDYEELTVAQLTAAGVDSDDELNELLGKELDTTDNTVSAYTPSTVNQRASRRTHLYRHLVRAMGRPVTLFAKDATEIDLLHKYATKIYACAQTDSNIDDLNKYSILEAGAKTDFRKLGGEMAISTTRRTAWTTYLEPEGGANQGSFPSVNNSFDPVTEASITVPSDWSTGYAVESVFV